MRRAVKLLAVLVLLALVIGLCGCGGGGSSVTPSLSGGDMAADRGKPPSYQYVATDLGSLGAWAVAEDINSSGAVVGYSRDAQNHVYAVLWQSGQTTPIVLSPDGSQAYAYGINDDGLVVGAVDNVAVRWSGGPETMETLTPPAGYPACYAHAVSAGGEIAGFGPWLYLDTRPICWDAAGQGTVLPVPAGTMGAAFDRNDSQMVGLTMLRAAPVDTSSQATVWQKDGGGTWQVALLGGLPGMAQSSAQGINGGGAIVGGSGSVYWSAFRAVLWQDGNKTDLGTLPRDPQCEALDINNAGVIVGYSKNSNKTRAVVWKNCVITDLNTVTDCTSAKLTQLRMAYAVNDNGWMVGDALSTDGTRHAFLAKPR